MGDDIGTDEGTAEPVGSARVELNVLGLAPEMGDRELLAMLRAHMYAQDCAASEAVDAYPNLTARVAPKVVEKYFREGLIKALNDDEHVTRITGGPITRNAVAALRRVTQRADGGPVRRHPETVGIHGRDLVVGALAELRFVVGGQLKSVAKFLREDYEALRDECYAHADGYARTAKFAEAGLRLLKKHGVDRTDALPAEGQKQLAAVWRKLRTKGIAAA